MIARRLLVSSTWLVLLAACGGENPEAAPEPGTPALAAPEDAAGDASPEIPDRSERIHAAADDAYTAQRERLVRRSIAGEGISDPAVLRAMRNAPRHRFVPERWRHAAYQDRPLPIGHGQTISQPYVVASMTEELRLTRGAKVLEIGTGSGYQAAVLAEITPQVFSIEIKEPLAKRAARDLADAGYSSVRVRHGDGYHGWEEQAPFDAIIVTAAAPHVPPPLIAQLKNGGRMVIPVGPSFAVQALMLVRKDERGRIRTETLYPVRFVPLTGSLGEAED